MKQLQLSLVSNPTEIDISADYGETAMNERVRAINHISEEVGQVGELFTSLAVLVHEQGEHIDNIETHIARANEFTEKGSRQLLKAQMHQQKSPRCMGFVCGCTAFVIAVGGLIVLYRTHS